MSELDIDATVQRFAIGARVRVAGSSAYAGDVGTVTTFVAGERYAYYVNFPDGDGAPFMASELESANAP
jgi:hypothetical protein